ncbi:MAG: choloylglycine hydrolase [Clostridia bacterium]|nr:choloylglycine hydrolase [Clostridia bacterium]
MCTALSFCANHHYFGRTLDLECSFGESIAILPRACGLHFRRVGSMARHHAIIGVAHIVDGYPLYYDAVNERGLAMAGLHFPGNAVYTMPERASRPVIAPFELIPWILGQTSTVAEAYRLLGRLQVCQLDFSPNLPTTPLHWLLADREQSLVVEPLADGLHIHDNPAGVLTNNPPFDEQLRRLTDFAGLTADPPADRMGLGQPLYSRGMGGMGLPGDLSSPSRFVRAAFTRRFARVLDSDGENLEQAFHILGSVGQTDGCVRLPSDEGIQYERTVYTSCYDTTSGVCHYTTYNNRSITAVNMRAENLDTAKLISYPMLTEPRIFRQNEK